MKLYRLGSGTVSLKDDLCEYFIDEEWNLYSLNSSTYVTAFGTRLVQLADGVHKSSGRTQNTLRTFGGKKKTFFRDNIAAQYIRKDNLVREGNSKQDAFVLKRFRVLRGLKMYPMGEPKDHSYLKELSKVIHYPDQTYTSYFGFIAISMLTLLCSAVLINIWVK